MLSLIYPKYAALNSKYDYFFFLLKQKTLLNNRFNLHQLQTHNGIYYLICIPMKKTIHTYPFIIYLQSCKINSIKIMNN